MNFKLTENMLKNINKACNQKKEIRLTVGYTDGTNHVIRTFGEKGELCEEGKLIYEIGSISKTFTATLFAKAVLENKMSLEDPIDQHIQGMDNGQYHPSLRWIATHSAGYSSAYPLGRLQYLGLFKDLIFGGSIEKQNPLFMDYEKMIGLSHQAGVKDKDYHWKYSNFGFALLGQAASGKFGGSYRETMNRFVHDELGLKDTNVGTHYGDALNGYNKKNLSCGNWQWTEGNFMAPAGAITSTAEDLLAYARMNMNDVQPYFGLCHKKHGKGPKGYDMGLGWWLRNGTAISEHGGGTGCFSSYLALDKKKKVAAVVLANYRLGKDDDRNICIEILNGIRNA